MPHKPDGYTIFCDDIRQEVGNKLSLMGIYSTEMFIHSPFPVTARMGFYVVFKEDPHAPFDSMTLCIYFPADPDDKPSYKAEIERSEGLPPPPNLDPTVRRTVGINVVVNPVLLKEAGKIKVRMLIGGEEVKLGTLNVKQAEVPPQAM